MCFNTKLTKSQEEIVKKFDIEIDDYFKANYKQGTYNGFEHPFTPVIYAPEFIDLGVWGLIPSWAHDTAIANKTLNARIETIHTRPAYKEVANNRVLILADGFFEWQWLDAKGNKKQKYKLSLPGEEIFTFAGLYQFWEKPELDYLLTYTILTTEANPLMSEIHNSKKRMPVIVGNSLEWLNGGELQMANDLLIPEKIFDKPFMGSLF